MPNTWRDTRDREADGPLLPLPDPVAIPEGSVAVGQIWASNDPRDRRNGWRQERIVVEVYSPSYAHRVGGMHFRLLARLYTLPGKPRQATSSCSVTDGLIERHRYVRPATPAELSKVAGKVVS